MRGAVLKLRSLVVSSMPRLAPFSCRRLSPWIGTGGPKAAAGVNPAGVELLRRQLGKGATGLCIIHLWKKIPAQHDIQGLHCLLNWRSSTGPAILYLLRPLSAFNSDGSSGQQESAAKRDHHKSRPVRFDAEAATGPFRLQRVTSGAKPLPTTESTSPNGLKRHLEYAAENKEHSKPYEDHARLLYPRTPIG
ncbi:hypothetical protein P0R31_36470 [Bradyrhizobium yuanmingense]|uniref:hypothetical protein n=1 Tax=Bradyrhizobium yuanmingense TaxID=108015 RepID=UPI0023BA15BD|nr:hypothetical protein [Bradyrhizobium yuanmingense]MDF0522735.1 hypothetical protein [Bradyrhizobium yuanmingense]